MTGVMCGVRWDGQGRSLRKVKEATMCKCYVKALEALSKQCRWNLYFGCTVQHAGS